jgi:very-short-patch-repair endonuclease
MRRTLIADRARAMRRAMSEPEVMLWSRLRGRGPEKPTFRRQHPFGRVILDFYCPAARLAIEVDGRTHWDDEAQDRDAARDRWLNGQGIEVMRVPASRIYHDLPGVTDAILRCAEARVAADARGRPSTPRSSLRSAGGPPPAASQGR